MILGYRKENPLESYEGRIIKQPGQRADSLFIKDSRAESSNKKQKAESSNKKQKAESRKQKIKSKKHKYLSIKGNLAYE